MPSVESPGIKKSTLAPLEAPLGVTVGRKATSIKWWAALGASWLLLNAYVLSSWFGSGDAKATPDGPTSVPQFMTIAIHTIEAITVIGFFLFVYFCVIRPWRRDHRLSFDGLCVFAFLTMFFQDAYLNYSQTWLTYNTEFLNLGSWYRHVPGWLSPDGNRLPEPLLCATMYTTVVFGAVMLANVVMRKAKAKWPSLGTVGLIGVCFCSILVVDLMFEPLMMRLGLFTYAGSIPWLTLWHGHYYQFPIYEAVLWGACWTTLACLRYFRNDRGLTIAERGVDKLRVSTRRKTGIRFLAIVGVINVTMLVTYNIPMQFFATHAAPWPKDITSRSYLNNGFCGTGTSIACSGPNIPIPRPDSARIGLDGKLIVPDGTKVP